MKNNFKQISIFVFTFLTFSLGVAQEKSLNTDNSKIRWYGEEITGKQHYGDLNFSSGSIEVKNNIITNGSFVVNMTSLTVEDLSGGGKKRLEGHLKSKDFFGVSDHQESTLKVTQNGKAEGDSQTLNGELTIKGITHPVSFTMKLETENSASAVLVFDRSKYNVRFRSGSFFDKLGDKLILDDIKLEVAIDFN